MSSFRVLLFFIALAVAGRVILPRLKVDLLPDEHSVSLSVSFSLPETSPGVMEQEITAVIENACSRLSELKKINSYSDYNYGYVTLQFDNSADIKTKKFEVSAIIRQIYPKLPVNTSYPLITTESDPVKEQNPLLVFSVSAAAPPSRIKQDADNYFRKALFEVQGISTIKVSGPGSRHLTILIDRNKCTVLQVDRNKIIAALSSTFTPSFPGSIKLPGGEEYFLRLSAPDFTAAELKRMLLTVSGGKAIYLEDVAEVKMEDDEPFDYFRINGKSSVSVSIYARKNENKIALSELISNKIALLRKQLPAGYEIRKEYNDIAFLKTEIHKNYRRAGISACVLLLFIFLAYRNWRFLLNLFSGLLVNLCITSLLAWVFGIAVHLYTIAGMAISFGIMTDNAIVMLDHFHRYRNRKIILAVISATFTTIATLCLIFFLPEEEKKNLSGFAQVIILCLISSLITSLWFTPAFYSVLNRTTVRLNKKKRTVYASKTRKKIIIRIYHVYNKLITFAAYHRKKFILLLVLAFGLPVFLLPEKWNGPHWYNRWYNNSIGTKHYQEKIRPGIDKWLGGAFRLFVNDVYDKSGYRSPGLSKLFINAELPYGYTLEQMNGIIKPFEDYLAAEQGVEKFITNIYSGQYATIEIIFKKETTNSTYPFQLKARLISNSLHSGGVSWNIYGIGQGFTNTGDEQIAGFRVAMYGYNYDELEKQAGKLAAKLARNNRVQKINTNDLLKFGEKKSEEYVLNLDDKKMAYYGVDKSKIVEQLTALSKPVTSAGQIIFENQYYPVYIKDKQADYFSVHHALNVPVWVDSAKSIRIGNMGMLEKRGTLNSIRKENRQYIRVVSFEYMGSAEFGGKFLTKSLEEMKSEMPVGYSASQLSRKWNWWKSNREYSLVLILLLAIFFICSVLFENLKQPFHIITIIPVSFIGLFLTFAWGGYYFDQGGYAAFVMLGGLVANAAIFIVNDFNNLRKNKPGHLYNRLLIKATAGRARTVFLTTISTCCGLIPFLLEGQNEVFWFSLAAGTIGGLLFSLFALFIVLPVLLWKKKTKPVPQRSTRTA